MQCQKCGKEVTVGAFCTGCGSSLIPGQERPAQAAQPAAYLPPQQQTYQQAPRTAVICPKCQVSNISFQAVNTAMGTRNRGRGCLWTVGRWALIICTLGLWLLVGRSKGKSNTKIKSQTQAVCQTCGNRWVV